MFVRGLLLSCRVVAGLGFPRARALGWLCLLALVGLTHCRRAPKAELLQVVSVAPREVQFGDSMQLTGDGFALGSAATVKLKGRVYRAGQAPAAVDVSMRAQTESQRELTLELPRALEHVFCGTAERASHATFRGDLHVAFAAKAPGAPPVTGSLRGTVLELYPAVKQQLAQSHTLDSGRQALAFFGLEVTESPEGGLLVVRTAPGSRAAAADLRPGDRLVRAGGLTVLQPSDLVPDAVRVLEVGVLRGSLPLTLELIADGFSPLPPAPLGWAALIIGALALAMAGLASPAARVLGWLVQSAADWRRARARVASKAGRRGPRQASAFSLLEALGGSLGVLTWLAVGAALHSPVLRSAPIDVSQGLLALMFGSAALLGVWGLIEGGRAGARWSLRRGARAALMQWLISAPGWVAVLAICCESGADFDDISRAQGVYPWQWNAFANPGLSLLFVLLLLTALPRAGRPLWRLAQARPSRVPVLGRGENPFGRLYLCSMCAVAAVTFCGGDAWPGQDMGQRSASLAAALLLLAKYTGLVLAVSLLRSISFGLTSEHWGPLSARYCLPMALAAAAFAYVFRALDGWVPFWRWLELGFGPVSFAALLLCGALVFWRLKAPQRPPSISALSPWL